MKSQLVLSPVVLGLIAHGCVSGAYISEPISESSASRATPASLPTVTVSLSEDQTSLKITRGKEEYTIRAESGTLWDSPVLSASGMDLYLLQMEGDLNGGYNFLALFRIKVPEVGTPLSVIAPEIVADATTLEERFADGGIVEVFSVSGTGQRVLLLVSSKDEDKSSADSWCYVRHPWIFAVESKDVERIEL